jgi:hypothetical protein
MEESMHERFDFLLIGLLVLASCGDETAINKIIGTSAEAPLFLAYKVVSETEIDFTFSTPVAVIQARFEPDLEIADCTEGETIRISLADAQAAGEKLIADLLVHDASGNTLNVLIPFRTRNDHIPVLLINEIRTENAKPKSEYIEFYTKTAGNMGALRIFAAAYSVDEPLYEFPPIEVAAGEYIVLHTRTIEGDKAVDETGDDLKASTSLGKDDAFDGARDLWIPSNTKLLHKTDVLYLVDQDDVVIDAVALCEKLTVWDKVKDAAVMLAKTGAWLDVDGNPVKKPEFADAVLSAGTTATRTICRDKTMDDSNSAMDWYICASSSATPGKENNAKRYIIK